VLIPADGGPVVVPRQSMAVNHHPSSIGSSSALDHYDTATDGMSSRRISVHDGRSSVTSREDEFLDVEDDIADTTAEGDDLQVDNVEVNDGAVDAEQWPWSSSTPYISSGGPTSRMIPAPAVRSQPLVSPLSDTAGITVGRNTVGMVSLNQPVSLVTVVTDEGDSSTPTTQQRFPSPRFATTVRGGATSDAGVRDFFAPAAEPWSHYVRSSPYPSVAPSPDRHPTNTTYHLNALRSAKDLNRQRYFSSGRVDGKSEAAHRSRPNGLFVQVSRNPQHGTVSAPAVSSAWQENNGWSLPPNPSNMDAVSREQQVINVRSRVVSPGGNQVGSKVTFWGGDVSPRQPYVSPMSQPLPGSPANWVYRL